MSRNSMIQICYFFSEKISGFTLFISNETYYSFFLPQMTHMNAWKDISVKKKNFETKSITENDILFYSLSFLLQRLSLLKITIKLKIAFQYSGKIWICSTEKKRLNINLFSNMEIIVCLKLSIKFLFFTLKLFLFIIFLYIR